MVVLNELLYKADRQLGLELPAIARWPDKLQGEGALGLYYVYDACNSIWKVKLSTPEQI